MKLVADESVDRPIVERLRRAGHSVEVVSLPGGWGTASANALTDADALDPISGFPRFRAGICRVSVRRT